MFMPHKTEMKLETLEPKGDDTEKETPEEKAELDHEEQRFEEALENDLKTDPYLKVHKADINAFRAFRRAFKLYNRNPESLDIYVVHPERNVAITRAFKKGDKVPNFHFLTETKGQAEMLKRKSGIEDVKKGIAEQHKQKADIVVVLDPDVHFKRNVDKSVEKGGWFLCRMKMANSVRATGKYKLMGVVDREDGTPRMNKNTEQYFEKAEVENDEAFKSAHDRDAVSYEDALAKVKEAGYSTKNVLESYKRLIGKAKEQNPDAIKNGETQLPCTIEHQGETIDLGKLNTVLPLQERDLNSENVVAFKKKKA